MKIENNFKEQVTIHPDDEYDVDREIQNGNNQIVDNIVESTIQRGKNKTVSELWKEKTGTDWSKAKKEGLTDGSYESNIEIKKQLMNGKFDNYASKTTSTNQFSETQRKEKIKSVKNNFKDLDKVSNFKEAFRIARDKLGPNQVFEWNGKIYNTALKGEDFQPTKDTIDRFNLNPELIKKQNKEVKSPFTSKEQNKLQPGYKNWESIKKRNKEINKMNNADKINQYYKNQKTEKSSNQYLIVDEKNARMHLYRDGELIDSFEVLTGKNKGDAQTVTKVENGRTQWGKGNQSTGAGIYTISNINPKSYYYGLPSFNLANEQGIEVSTTIHGTPYKRRKYFDDGNLENNRQSYGCINGRCTDLKELYSKYGLSKGDKVYILPEDDGNKFIYQDDKIIMKSSAKNREDALSYIDSEGNKQKGQGINYSIKTLDYKPIKAFINKSEFEKNVYQWNDFNDDEEYEKTTKPFVDALVKNKKEIMQKAKVSSDVYNELVKVSFGIYGTESNFGDTHSAIGNLGRAITKYVDNDTSSPDYKSKYNTYKINENYRSVGLTQIRWSFLNKDEKKVLKELGINSNKDFLNPKKAAIGTIAILATRYNQQLTSEEKKDIMSNLPKKWNNRDNYSDRVKSNSRFLSIKQLNE